uniref:DUF4249 domain-containing protein n=1 Tax=uncultured Draconibacterium sp. TaxID=1573823 RepID=UPI0032174DED
MYHYLKLFSIILPLAILFCSCEKTIDFNSDQVKPKIVVNALLTQGTKVSVSITKSKSLLSDKDYFEVLANAKADLYVNDEFVETLEFESRADTLEKHYHYGAITKTPVDKGVYTSETEVEAGKTYRLEVACDGMDNVSCETTVPMPVEIISVDTVTVVADENEYYGKYLAYRLKFKDPEDMSNYYRFQMDYTRGTVLTRYADEQYVNTDTVVLYESYYYGYQLDDPIFENSENEANDIVMGTPENQYAIFTDKKINGKEYTLSSQLFNYSNSYSEEQAPGNFMTYRLTLYSINKDYFDYLNTVNYQSWYSDDYFSEPVPVYSNVEGGLGIWSSAGISQYNLTEGDYPVSGKIYISQEDLNQNWGGYGYNY